jgi:hypothetical protein
VGLGGQWKVKEGSSWFVVQEKVQLKEILSVGGE